MATEQEYQEKNRSKSILTVYLFLLRSIDNRILISLREGTGYEDGNWELPSGHVEDGELPIPALLREVSEELGGITLFPGEIKLVHTSYRPQHDKTGNRVDLFFRTSRWHGEIRVGEPNKCGGQQWASVHRLPKNFVPHQRHAISCIVEEINYSELSTEWLKDNDMWKLP